MLAHRRDFAWRFWGIWARHCDRRSSVVKRSSFWMSHTANERWSREWTWVGALVAEVMGHRLGSLLQASSVPSASSPCPLGPPLPFSLSPVVSSSFHAIPYSLEP